MQKRERNTIQCTLVLYNIYSFVLSYQLLLRWRIRGSIHPPPTPHTSSWLSAWLVKHRDNFTFTSCCHNFIWCVVPGIYAGRNIPVSDEKDWKLAVRGRIAEYLMVRLLYRRKKKKVKERKTGSMYSLITVWCTYVGRAWISDCDFRV
jgi:hypothetical protein